MSLEGMDVDQAQGLARQLDGYGQALAHISAALAGLAAELSHSWRGPTSATFQQQCTVQYRPSLSNAEQALNDMHAHLAANIQQQIRTSAADSGSSRTWGVIAGLTTVLGKASDTWDDRVGRFTDPLEKIEKLAGNDWVTGRYDKTWTRLMDLDRNSSLLKFKQSPVLHALHDNPLIQGADHLLTVTHADKVLETLGPVGTAIGWAAVGSDVGQSAIALHDHQYASAGGHLVDATADYLKTRGGPVAYLAGADIVIWKENYDLASQIDWKQGIPNPFNAGTFREDYLPTFKSMPGQVAGILEKAFG